MFLLLISCNSTSKSGFSSHSVSSYAADESESAVPNSCAEPVESTWEELVDTAKERGLVLDIPLWDSHSVCAVIPGGVVAQDLNNDGDIDLVFENPTGSPWAFRNKGDGAFVEVNIDKRLFGAERPGLALAAVDINGDSLPELIQSGAGYLAIAENLGDFRFSPWSLIIDDFEYPFSCYGSFSLGDFDQDGDLDIALAGTDEALSIDDYPGARYPNIEGAFDLLIEQDNESWMVIDQLSAWDDIAGLSILQLFTDWDNDRDLDLISGSDRTDGIYLPPMAFWENRVHGTETVFVEQANELGTDLPINAMGLGAQDLNQDGFLDYCMTDVRNALVCFVSDGIGGFYESGLSFGLQVEPAALVGAPTSWNADSGEFSAVWVAWSLLMEDIDNDGFIDIATAAGATPDYGSVAFSEMESWQPDWLWMGTQAGFQQADTALPFFDSRGHYGMVSVDLNKDGFREIVKVPAEGNPQILENPCSENNWLEIDLLGTVPNSEGFGAKVFVHTETYSHQQEMFNLLTVGQGPSMLHVGLGQETQVQEIVVWWPDGATSTLNDVDVNQHITVVHPNAISE